MALYGSSPEIPKFAARAQIVFTDVTGAIVGGSAPILIEHSVTLVGSPNPYSHRRLMQLLGEIVPEAGEVDEGNTAAPVREDYGNPVTPVVLADEVPADDDEGGPAEPPRTLPGEVGN